MRWWQVLTRIWLMSMKKVSSGKGSMRTTFACAYSHTPFQEGAISQVACCLHDEDYVAVATR